MAQLCAGAMYGLRPSFHFDSAISGSDGGATVPPSGTPSIDSVMGNDGTVLRRAGYEAKHAIVTVGMCCSLKLEDLRGAGSCPRGRSPSGVSRRTISSALQPPDRQLAGVKLTLLPERAGNRSNAG